MASAKAAQIRKRPGWPAAPPLFCALLALLLLWGLTACKDEQDRTKAAAPQRPPAPVSVAPVQARDLPVTLDSLGEVTPSAEVLVGSRVGGQLLEVHFKEGDQVKKGDLLFTIDPQSFQVLVEVAQADLKRNQAQLRQYQLEVQRRRHLLERKYISEEDYQKLQTQVATQSASLEASRANLQKAQLDLSYCRVKAPISGRAGRILIQPGNQVSPGAGSAVVDIVNSSPAYVVFSLPEDRLAEVVKFQTDSPLEVRAWNSAASQPISGELNFINSQVDRDTGSFYLRALFANQDKALWPGQSLKVELVLYIQKGALTVPSQAVQLSPQGQFVYVVKPDDTVEMRPARIMRAYGQDAVLEGGIKPGEEVVTDGHLMLYPGAKIVRRQVPAMEKSLQKQREAK